MISRSRMPYPPGPPGDYIIGNLRQMPTTYAWLTFSEWACKYGPISYISIANKSALVINSHEAALDLLDKRAAVYSDRPRFVMACELCGMEDATVFLGYGALLKKHRKLLAQSLHPRVVERDFVPLQERSTHKLANALLDDPDNFVNLIEQCFGNTIQAIAYGQNDGPDDFVELARRSAKNAGKVIQGYAVDFLPWLKYLPEWFPGAQFHRDAKLTKEVAEKTRWLPFNMVQNGTAPPSFVSSALSAMRTSKADDIDENIISGAAFVLFGAATETTSNTLATFILAMLLHPEIQARAQAEIDRVIGDHLPTLASRDSTPYLNAVITETLRWHPSLPLGVPHCLTRDDMYNGYFIPRGTMVIVNIWGILHDENHFPEPFKFDPDRFLPGDYAGLNSPLPAQPQEISKVSIDPWAVAFGYGRRICPGISVAQSALWIATATILSHFNIRQKLDPETSEPMVTEPRFSGDSVSFPVPFPCDIKPRSRSHAERIKEAISADVAGNQP
ncbi:hypothetical protein FRB97_002942 [Tulasnella sp. 331]|nr:hypothetical protein FRB97_002942 [Tulasnella sp. 331]